ncbi:MAG: enoyl-CoA hydratase/isomerase family protein [Gammaproteobacteria bacterium]|nr:enoyl-CoA hydratase/isomerase family protein [Gammaproteobacteria bacterium]
MTYKHLQVEKSDNIALVTMNRPEKANALNYDHLEEIEHAALSFSDDGKTRVVIFTGAGKHFSSGADLTDPGRGGDVPMVLRRRHNRMGERAIRALHGMDQITIAAWNGAAMGGGACIATALDFRVGADDCFMAYPEIDIGVNLMWTSLPLITHLAGPARAKRLVMGGEHIHAPTLQEWGILDALVPRSELMDRTRELAAFYAGKSPIPAQMIKRSVNAIVSALDTSIMHMDFDQHLLSSTTSDRAEAVRAYTNKEQPTFEGR